MNFCWEEVTLEGLGDGGLDLSRQLCLFSGLGSFLGLFGGMRRGSSLKSLLGFHSLSLLVSIWINGTFAHD